MFFVGFIVINQVVGWFLRVDYLEHPINWSIFDTAFSKHYCLDNGRPSKPIRLMVGLTARESL
jgi:IS5 family transposase